MTDQQQAASVKRYAPVIYIAQPPTWCKEFESGDFVKWHDYQAAIAERDAAAEDAKRLSRVREEVRVEYTKRIERANHLRDEGFNGSQIHLIELEASCYLRVIGIIDRLTAPAAGATDHA